MSHRTDSSGTSTDGLSVSRRTVVKAGAHAAWVVPLVQLATAAPALAVSNQLSVTQATGSYSAAGSTTINTLISVKNGSASDTSVSIQLSFPKANPAWKVTTTTPSGFTVQGNNSATITYTGTIAAGATVSITPTLTVPSGHKGDAVNIGVVATATGLSNGVGSIVVTASH